MLFYIVIVHHFIMGIVRYLRGRQGRIFWIPPNVCDSNLCPHFCGSHWRTLDRNGSCVLLCQDVLLWLSPLTKTRFWLPLNQHVSYANPSDTSSLLCYSPHFLCIFKATALSLSAAIQCWKETSIFWRNRHCLWTSTEGRPIKDPGHAGVTMAARCLANASRKTEQGDMRLGLCLGYCPMTPLCMSKRWIYTDLYRSI